MAKTVTRLYEQFHPDNYKLELEPDREKMRFSGNVIIHGKKVGAPSRRITLHQKGLKVSGAELVRHGKGGDETVAITRINQHAKFDELRIHTNEKLFPSSYTLKLLFSGKISEQMHGIYPCNFQIGTKSKKLIATQFESHYAREVFPCIDEPEAKATFELTLTTPKGETVIANTPVVAQSYEGAEIKSTFEPTPKMSTYLLAFAYGDLGYIEAKTSRGVLVRTYATPDKVKFTKFALDVAVRCIDFYENYFEVEYPLPKLDMIALPDFSSGAMENWGLVTYREQAMLVDPKNTSLEAKQYVAMVIAHELAHQWFGNLVTMRWWTDLWLNEGFASWVEYLAVNKLFPDWHMWTQFIVDDQLAGLRSDALSNTHPVEVPISHPDEIRTIFDDISYQKGASVIHMLQAYLGAEVFRLGLVHYLSKHAYANAVTTDLWKAFEETSGKKVRLLMHNWVSKAGHPLLSVNFDNKHVELTQNRFFAQKTKTKDNTIWHIPLHIDGPALMSKQNLKLRTDSPTVINKGHSGFYTTIYDKATYQVLSKSVSDRQLSETDRLGLINDAHAAAKAGYLPTAEVLKMLASYSSEDSSPVWDSLSILLGDIRRVFDDESLIESMKPYTHDLVTKQLKRLGWQPKKSESHFDTLLRPTILSLASWSKDPSVVAKALADFKAMRKVEDVEPDLRGVIYHTAARQGGSSEFQKLKSLYKQTSTASEKVTLASALCSFKQPNLYKQAIDMIKSEEVRPQDISYWVVYGFSNRHAKHEMWQWLKQNWGWMEKKLGAELSFARMPLYAARCFSDQKFMTDYQSFFEPKLSAAFKREYLKGLETIAWQAAWRSRDEKDIKQFFS